MKYIIRIGIFTWMLIDIIKFFASIEWAITIAIPIGMLLFTIFDDKEVKRVQKRPASRQA